MAKKTMKSTTSAPAVDSAPVTPATKTSKPRATAVPRPAKPQAATGEGSISHPLLITEQMIAERAYHKWQNGEQGSDFDRWIASESELRNG